MQWPDSDLFPISSLDILEKIRVRKGDWLGVYEGLLQGIAQGKPSQDILCASRSPAVLRRRLAKMSLTFPLFVKRARSRNEIPLELKPAPPDRTTQLRRSAYEAVADARNVLDPNGLFNSVAGIKRYEWFVYELSSFDKSINELEANSLHGSFKRLCHLLFDLEERGADWSGLRPNVYRQFSREFVEQLHSEIEKGSFRVSDPRAQKRIDKFLAAAEEAVSERFQQMSSALDFLRDIANHARRTGGKVGDSATHKEMREVMMALDRLARGEPLKAIAQVTTGDDVDDAKSLKRYKSLERAISRFCKRLAAAVQKQYGPRISTLDFPHLMYVVRDWAWIDSRRDRMALMEAARRALPDLKVVSSI